MSKLEVWTERVVLIFIALICVSLTYAIVETAHRTSVLSEREPAHYVYPSVPECDASVWDRITKRCK